MCQAEKGGKQGIDDPNRFEARYYSIPNRGPVEFRLSLHDKNDQSGVFVFL